MVFLRGDCHVVAAQLLAMTQKERADTWVSPYIGDTPPFREGLG